MTFAERFANLLAEREITVYKMSKDIAIPDVMIGRWKSGKALPSFEKLILISEYLGVSVNLLVTGKESDIAPNDQQLLDKYHAAGVGIQESVRKLLDIE